MFCKQFSTLVINRWQVLNLFVALSTGMWILLFFYFYLLLHVSVCSMEGKLLCALKYKQSLRNVSFMLKNIEYWVFWVRLEQRDLQLLKIANRVSTHPIWRIKLWATWHLWHSKSGKRTYNKIKIYSVATLHCYGQEWSGKSMRDKSVYKLFSADIDSNLIFN